MGRFHATSRHAAAVLVALAAGVVMGVVFLGSDLPSKPSLPARFSGIAVDVIFGDPSRAAIDDVDAAAALGVDALRVGVAWADFEPVGRVYARYYLRALDALVARARQRGLRVLLTPVATPCWAAVARPSDAADACRAPPGRAASTALPPAQPADYARLLTFLAGRYGSTLCGIEVWNEPNLSSTWSSARPAADYAALLKAGYAAVKRVAPSLPVVAGALAGADGRFLQELYEAGIEGHYDVLSVHAYNDGRPPDQILDPALASTTIVQGLRALDVVLRRRGERHPVWVTELGWNTSSQRGGAFLDGVSEAQQGAYIRRTFALLGSARSGIAFPASIFVYRLRDVGGDPADPQQNYGLLRVDGTPKRGYAAVRAAFAAR